jgi:hypothetical protein
MLSRNQALVRKQFEGHSRKMPIKASPRKPKPSVYVGKFDMSSPATLDQFRAASAAYTSKAVKSKASAVKTLQQEGILTRSGKFTKTYTTS